MFLGWVYPRVCGGTRPRRRPSSHASGLSPRVRGNLLVWLLLRRSCRSIPACAGEPLDRLSRSMRDLVYPRVCGGTDGSRTSFRRRHGLSPRVRGNHEQPDHEWRCRRSIPACAGEPAGYHRSALLKPVYPRVCGGTSFMRRSTSFVSGLSPRVRGNLKRKGRAGRVTGSIPACAGEPL